MRKRRKKFILKKKYKKYSLVLSIVFFALIAVNLYLIFLFPLNFSGLATSVTGQASFEILGVPTIYIFSPENITYNFSIGDPLFLDLNVSASSPVHDWMYTLYDEKHDEWVNNWTLFTPNMTIPVVRWGNHLFVNATGGSGLVGSADVMFFVYVPNSPPILYGFPDNLFVCEGNQTNLYFYAIDVDEDVLGGILNPTDPFYFLNLGQNRNRTDFQLFSDPLLVPLNTGALNYNVTMGVQDGEYSDSNWTNVTVIEMNNLPNMMYQEVETIWNKGENSTFFRQILVLDQETSEGWGNIQYGVSIRDPLGNPSFLFNISDNGVMNFTADENTTLGVYDVRVCINDTGITHPFEDIFLYCNQTGANNTFCSNFGLTVVETNRPPTITNYFPLNDSLAVSGGQLLYFNVTDYDPDYTIPDTFWYVDHTLREFDNASLEDEFFYTFPCGVGGEHHVKAEVTDGLLNDSVTWNITVRAVDCPSGSSSGGGGGGGGGGGASFCEPKWGCSSWNVCQNAKASLEAGILSGVKYRTIEKQCEEKELDEFYCGYQIRYCNDVNNCSNLLDKPEEIQYCIYTSNPSCNDGLLNCHDGSCELLIDCGGPCDACPTCSDNVKNQGEEGVDCGGPCPWKCIPEVPFFKRTNIIYGALILLLILIIFIIIKLVRVLKYKIEINRQNRKDQNTKL